MKLEIVKMANPADPTNKTARPTLLYGSAFFMGGELWQVALPMTSNCCGQKGGVYLSEKSPAFSSTGLNKPGCIKIASAFRFRVSCETAELCQRTGHFLNLSKDKQLHSQFGVASMEAAQALGDLQRLPVAF